MEDFRGWRSTAVQPQPNRVSFRGAKRRGISPCSDSRSGHGAIPRFARNDRLQVLLPEKGVARTCVFREGGADIAHCAMCADFRRLPQMKLSRRLPLPRTHAKQRHVCATREPLGASSSPLARRERRARGEEEDAGSVLNPGLTPGATFFRPSGPFWFRRKRPCR